MFVNFWIILVIIRCLDKFCVHMCIIKQIVLMVYFWTDLLLVLPTLYLLLVHFFIFFLVVMSLLVVILHLLTVVLLLWAYWLIISWVINKQTKLVCALLSLNLNYILYLANNTIKKHEKTSIQSKWRLITSIIPVDFLFGQEGLIFCYYKCPNMSFLWMNNSICELYRVIFHNSHLLRYFTGSRWHI